ncbi:unnamed protein product [Arctogadus glacialis]
MAAASRATTAGSPGHFIISQAFSDRTSRSNSNNDLEERGRTPLCGPERGAEPPCVELREGLNPPCVELREGLNPPCVELREGLNPPFVELREGLSGAQRGPKCLELSSRSPEEHGPHRAAGPSLAGCGSPFWK